MEEFLRISEVAKRLKITRKTVSRYIKAGKLKAFCIGTQYRVFGSSLDKLIDKTTKKEVETNE